MYRGFGVAKGGQCAAVASWEKSDGLGLYHAHVVGAWLAYAQLERRVRSEISNELDRVYDWTQ
jgi:hypothetical protein